MGMVALALILSAALSPPTSGGEGDLYMVQPLSMMRKLSETGILPQGTLLFPTLNTALLAGEQWGKRVDWPLSTEKTPELMVIVRLDRSKISPTQIRANRTVEEYISIDPIDLSGMVTDHGVLSIKDVFSHPLMNGAVPGLKLDKFARLNGDEIKLPEGVSNVSKKHGIRIDPKEFRKAHLQATVILEPASSDVSAAISMRNLLQLAKDLNWPTAIAAFLYAWTPHRAALLNPVRVTQAVGRKLTRKAIGGVTRRPPPPIHLVLHAGEASLKKTDGSADPPPPALRIVRSGGSDAKPDDPRPIPSGTKETDRAGVFLDYLKRNERPRDPRLIPWMVDLANTLYEPRIPFSAEKYPHCLSALRGVMGLPEPRED